MKLTDIIKYFESDNTLAEFCTDNNYLPDNEQTLVYMADALNIDSDLFFFTAEQTADERCIEIDGKNYFSLFSLELGVEFYSYFEKMFNEEQYSQEQKANRILEYVINDA